MDLMKIAARVAADPMPSRETVDKVIAKAWHSILRPFEMWNAGDESPGPGVEPVIGDEARTKHVDFGSGWEFILRAEHDDVDGYDGRGDYIVLKFLNPVTKSAETVYEGPDCTLGLDEPDFNEMIDAAFDAIATAAASKEVPN